MSSAGESVADLIQDSIAHAELHRRLLESLKPLAALAAESISAHDMGMKLLALLGSEAAVKEYLQQKNDALNKAFTDWYIAARIAAHEGRKPK